MESHPSPFLADLDKYYRICFGTRSPPLLQRIRLWATHYGFHCVAAYRFDRFARRLAHRHPVAAFPLARAAGALGHAVELLHHVRVYADVGPGFFIGHASTIYIGPTAIGRNFSVTHNVTVGVGHSAGREGIPIVGDDVWVGTGSVLAGAIQVGNAVTVANGTMLQRSVPDGCLVAGNPGRVVPWHCDNAALFGQRQEPAPGPLPRSPDGAGPRPVSTNGTPSRPAKGAPVGA